MLSSMCLSDKQEGSKCNFCELDLFKTWNSSTPTSEISWELFLSSHFIHFLHLLKKTTQIHQHLVASFKLVHQGASRIAWDYHTWCLKSLFLSHCQNSPLLLLLVILWSPWLTHVLGLKFIYVYLLEYTHMLGCFNLINLDPSIWLLSWHHFSLF